MENDGPQWKIVIPPKILKKICKIQEKEQIRIKKKILALKEGVDKSDCKRLQGRMDWSLHIGRWRVLFLIDLLKKNILITDFGPRGDIYK